MQADAVDSLVPKVSIFLLAYKMEKTIIEALVGALSQTVPCEIIVSDDASNDRSYELASEYIQGYEGPHKVIVRRNEQNQGLCQHINTLARLASGDIFVFMAADDVSHPFRVGSLLEELRLNPNAHAVGSSVDEIDEQGNVIRRDVWGIPSPFAQKKFLNYGRFVTLLGASMAIRRNVLTELPPLVGTVEDTMLTLRASLFGPVVCINKPLLLYRRHQQNLGSWVYARVGNRHGHRRIRYERTIKIYREIAQDHENCLQVMRGMQESVRCVGEKIVSMYRLEADAREALISKSKLEWIPYIMAGLRFSGLRRKSIERILKIIIPRSLSGL